MLEVVRVRREILDTVLNVLARTAHDSVAAETTPDRRIECIWAARAVAGYMRVMGLPGAAELDKWCLDQCAAAGWIDVIGIVVGGTPDEVIDECCRELGMSRSVVLSHHRKRIKSHARKLIARSLHSQFPDMTLKQIGAVMGGWHHTSVLYWLGRVDRVRKAG